MHVAFGRVRRKSRIVADYTDCADFGGKSGICNAVADGNGLAHRRRNEQDPRFSEGIFVYLRFWSGERGYGYYGLRTQTGKFAVQKRRESEFPPMNRRIASPARSYRR